YEKNRINWSKLLTVMLVERNINGIENDNEDSTIFFNKILIILQSNGLYFGSK
ncbi:hypothetical protein DERP_001507, partial [Dermatophagoides pteronyssinus]